MSKKSDKPEDAHQFGRVVPLAALPHTHRYCHNELIRALGLSKDIAERESVKITFWQSVFMPWFDWFPSALKKNGGEPISKTGNPPPAQPAQV